MSLFGSSNRPKTPLDQRNYKMLHSLTSKVLIVAVAVMLLSAGARFISNRMILNDQRLADDYYKENVPSAALEAKYSGMGSFAAEQRVIPSKDKSLGDIYVYYPEGALERGEKLPLVLVGNPSKTPAKTYLPFFERLASWGFIVAGNCEVDSGNGGGISATLDFLLIKTDIADIIDTDNVGIAGYSLGGAGALAAASMYNNSDAYKAIYTGSAPYPTLAKQNKWEYDVSKITASCFVSASTGETDDTGVEDIEAEYGGIAPLKGLNEIYDALPDSSPKLLARIKDADHDDVLVKSDGYMTAWMLWLLKGDEQAAQAFRGEGAEILSNPGWQDAKGNM